MHWLLCDALGLSLSELYQERERLLTLDELLRICAYIERRRQGEPLAYIHGEVDFYGCKIAVTPQVLIPRPETELLVDLVVQDLEKQDLSGKVLADLCSGSGCIGVALKKRFPQLQVLLLDVSEVACAVAKENARRNGVKVEVLCGDLVEGLGKVDYVICNPPYISRAEYRVLDVEVRQWEPREALEAGDSGLEFYQRLASELPSFLKEGAKLWLELGYAQGEAVKAIFSSGSWKQLWVGQDYAGWDRFFKALFA